MSTSEEKAAEAKKRIAAKKNKEIDLSGADLSQVPHLSFERTAEDIAWDHTVPHSKNEEEKLSGPDVKNKRETQQEVSSEIPLDRMDLCQTQMDFSHTQKVDLSYIQEQAIINKAKKGR